MGTGRFEGLSAKRQLDAWAARALDPRPSIATGWPGLDSLLHRGGLGPGTMVVLGGRTHTRKTTVALNIVANQLQAGVPVGFVTLDEPVYSYVAKLASVITRTPHDWLEENWTSQATERARETYLEVAGALTMTEGYRPEFEDLSGWLETAEYDTGERPRVVFIDYSTLLARGRFDGKDATRVPLLMENLQVWTKQEDIVTVVLHQVGKTDEGHKYHGDTPMTLESLKFAGEEFADIVLGTFRPALNPLGNMTRDQAEMELGDRYDEEAWDNAVARVRKYRQSTFLQLLKNRPGVHLEPQGIELRSPDDSLYMTPTDETVDDRGQNLAP